MVDDTKTGSGTTEGEGIRKNDEFVVKLIIFASIALILSVVIIWWKVSSYNQNQQEYALSSSLPPDGVWEIRNTSFKDDPVLSPLIHFEGEKMIMEDVPVPGSNIRLTRTGVRTPYPEDSSSVYYLVTSRRSDGQVWSSRYWFKKTTGRWIGRGQAENIKGGWDNLSITFKN